LLLDLAWPIVIDLNGAYFINLNLFQNISNFRTSRYRDTRTLSTINLKFFKIFQISEHCADSNINDGHEVVSGSQGHGHGLRRGWIRRRGFGLQPDSDSHRKSRQPWGKTTSNDKTRNTVQSDSKGNDLIFCC
jgi:hypothetical protein